MKHITDWIHEILVAEYMTLQEIRVWKIWPHKDTLKAGLTIHDRQDTLEPAKRTHKRMETWHTSYGTRDVNRSWTQDTSEDTQMTHEEWTHHILKERTQDTPDMPNGGHMRHYELVIQKRMDTFGGVGVGRTSKGHSSVRTTQMTHYGLDTRPINNKHNTAKLENGHMTHQKLHTRHITAIL